jgi:cytochrome c oxidase subunit II
MKSGNSNNSRLSVPLPFIIAFGLLVIFGGYAIGVVLTPILLPPQASAESQQVDELFKIMLIIGGAIFILVQGLLVYSVIRFRTPAGDTTDGPPVHGNATLELVWTGIPAVIVLVLVILSYAVWVDIQAKKPNENLVNGVEVPVTAYGQRFAWSFAYDTPVKGDDGNPITLNAKYLHTFVGQNVNLTLETRDVIHSFWIPAMRGKQDLMPGRTTDIRFTPDLPGEYRIVCAELCGGGHGEMFSYVIVHPDEETYLAEFYDPAIELALNPPEDPVILGEQVLVTGKYPCANCHVLESLGWGGITGPVMDGIGDRAARRREGYTAEEYLVESLYQSGTYLVPGFGDLMPHFNADPDSENPMPAEDLEAIVAYLCTQTETGNSACSLDNIDSIIQANTD